MLERLLAEYPESRSVSQALFRALADADKPDPIEGNIQALRLMLQHPTNFAAMIKNDEIAVAWGKLVIAGFMRGIVRQALDRLDGDPHLDSQFSSLEKRALREMQDVDIGTGVTPDQSKMIIELLGRLGPTHRVERKRDSE